MKSKNLRRAIASASVLTIAAGLTAAIGMSTATAATDSISWADGGSNFKRTISDTNPAIGDTITVTTNFYRTGAVEYVQQVRDEHPTCLTIVGAKVDGSNQSIESQGPTFARVTGSWSVYPNINPKTRAFEFTYKVGEDCKLNTALPTGMSYNGSLGAGGYGDKGPSITVKQATSTTTVAITPAPQALTATTLTATVTPAAATGTVEFLDGTTSLGTAPLTDSAAKLNWTPALNQGGQNYSITAKYLGDTNREPSTSAATTGTIAVGLIAPAAPTGLVSSANPATAGTPVTISGLAEANSNVTVTAGTQTCTATAASNGTFSCTLTPAAAGQIPTTATATNPAGTSPKSTPLNLTVKPAPVAPAAPSLNLSAGNVTLGKPVTVTATTEAGNTLTITADGHEIFNGPSATGTQTVNYTPTAAGASTVTATAGNAVGTSPATTKTVTVTPAPTAPAAPSIPTLTPATVVTGQATTVTGDAEANSTVTVTAGSNTCTAATDAQGKFSCTIIPTTAGQVQVTATATNAVGTGPASAPVTLTVNAAIVIPAAPTVTASPTTVAAGQPVTVTATTDAGNTLVITADGHDIFNGVSATGTETVNYSPTAEGSSTVTATAGNSAGTSGLATKTITVTAAPTAPAAPTNLEMNPRTIVVGTKSTVTGKAEPHSTVWVNFGIKNAVVAANAQGDFSATLNGSDVGQFEVTAYAINSVGRGPSTSAGILNVNASSGVPYSPNLTVAESSITVGQAVAVTATTQAGNTLTITVNGHDIFNGVSATGTETVNFTPTAAGSYRVTATARNSAGTSGLATKTITVAAAPTVPAKPTDLTATPSPATVGEMITVSGKAEAHSTVKVSAGLQSCDATAGAAGDFSCQLTAANEGLLTITAVASNGLGASAPSDPISVQVAQRPLAPPTPEVTLSASHVQVGEPVTVAIKTAPGATVAITIDGTPTPNIIADTAGNAAHTFNPTTAGTVAVRVTASNDGGTSTPAVTSVEVTALPPGEPAISVNPSAPVAGDTVKLTVTNADAGTTVTIKNGDVVVCSAPVSADGVTECEWRPGRGSYDLTITATVDGAEQSFAKRVVVAAAPVDPVDPEQPATGSLGSLGSLGAIFGSLGK